MPILWAILWGISTPLIMWATMEYWLPKLTDRAAKPAVPDAAEDPRPNPGQFMPRTRFFQKNSWRIIFLLACGIFAAVTGHAAGTCATSTVSLLRMYLTFSVLACITVVDGELFIIPNECSLVMFAGGCVLLIVQWIAQAAFPVSTLIGSAISLIICLILFLIMAAVTRGGFGMGDVKILSSIAFLCGIRTVCYTLTLALIFSALGSAILLLTKKKQLKDLLPLGPFLWLAMGISVLLRLI